MAAVALTNARLYDELQTASRIRSEFVSTISHELRTPLNVMLGYLEMVRDPDLTHEEKLQLLDRSQQNGFQLLALIESTLEIGRIDAGPRRGALGERPLRRLLARARPRLHAPPPAPSRSRSSGDRTRAT